MHTVVVDMVAVLVGDTVDTAAEVGVLVDIPGMGADTGAVLGVGSLLGPGAEGRVCRGVEHHQELKPQKK